MRILCGTLTPHGTELARSAPCLEALRDPPPSIAPLSFHAHEPPLSASNGVLAHASSRCADKVIRATLVSETVLASPVSGLIRSPSRLCLLSAALARSPPSMPTRTIAEGSGGRRSCCHHRPSGVSRYFALLARTPGWRGGRGTQPTQLTTRRARAKARAWAHRGNGLVSGSA